jgi:sugar lactone lactonase YvrE
VKIGSETTLFLYLPPALKDLPPGYITTVAGVGQYYGDYRPALEAAISAGQIDFGPDGSLYLAEVHHHRVMRVRPDGILEPFAGTGRSPEAATFKSPAPPLEIAFEYARSIVVEDDGDVVIADDPSHRIWRVDASTGLAHVLAGTGEAGFSGDGGAARNARINEPNFLAGDKKGTIWFVDWGNSRIRRIDPDGTIRTICGTGTPGFSGDGGPALQATFDTQNPDAGNLAYDPSGFLYLADFGNRRIRRLDLGAGTIDTFIGPDRNPLGLPLQQRDLRALLVGPAGDVYLTLGSQIIHVTRAGSLIEKWGSPTGPVERTFDGTRFSDVLLGGVIGFALDRNGNLLYSDDDVNRVMRLNRQTGLLETVISAIGPGVFGENGPALAASPIEAIGPQPDLVVTPAGELIFSGRRIRKVGLDGRLSVVEGTGQAATFGDNQPATQSSYITGGLDMDASGKLFAATFYTIVGIDTAGILRRVAGGGSPRHCGLEGEGGPARDAVLCQPWDVAVDRDGNLFIADTNHNRIRRVDAKTQFITTIAGSGAINGFENYYHGTFCGDGGPATQACLNTPLTVAVNSSGEVFFTEYDPQQRRLRKIDRNGIISTLGAGSYYLTFDAADNLYMWRDASVVRVTPDGRSTLLAGPGNAHGFGGDGGPAGSALFSGIGGGIGFDREGNLYMVDGGNRRIRAVRYGAVLAPPGASITLTTSGPAIRATVRDSSGRPASNVRVDFTAPSSGASCTLSQPFAITDANGAATVTCTANCVTGAYTVTANVLNAGQPSSVSLSNGSYPCRRRSVRH